MSDLFVRMRARVLYIRDSPGLPFWQVVDCRYNLMGMMGRRIVWSIAIPIPSLKAHVMPYKALFPLSPCLALPGCNRRYKRLTLPRSDRFFLACRDVIGPGTPGQSEPLIYLLKCKDNAAYYRSDTATMHLQSIYLKMKKGFSR
jgi:hypothetical protein